MRIVIKIGTSTLAHPTGLLNIRLVEELCKTISDIKNAGHEVIVVSSGAIGMGVGKLGLLQRPQDIPTKQAAAAVGQCELMYTYDKLFGEYNHTVAQLLITGEDVENDTVATHEIVIGDNDTRAAIVAQSIGAEKLILLSDIDGLYTADPHTHPEAQLISLIEKIDDSVRALGGASASKQGTGGMVTKLRAAEICTGCGCDMVIANGRNPSNLYDILSGKAVGTTFKGVTL
ncbi:MAG: glutamate 5-kinase [Oscillospiraceae bacterium]|nr:glutamate 5-kinase [Oscillospiraceae bacterium]